MLESIICKVKFHLLHTSKASCGNNIFVRQVTTTTIVQQQQNQHLTDILSIKHCILMGQESY